MADVTIEQPCQMCGSKTKVTMTEAQLTELRAPRRHGRFIQDILYTHPPEVRELFVSGTCPKCWEKMFPKELE